MNTLLQTDPATTKPGRAKSATPFRYSILDQMVIYLLDNVSLNGGVTIDDLETAGFSRREIGDHANEAARIARRRFIRQLGEIA